MDVEYKDFPDKAGRYDYLNAQLAHILAETDDLCAALANASALFYLLLPQLNWAGFYRMQKGALVLGPFQGKPAVAHIEIGAGVCGTAVQEGAPQIVKDVHCCCNHIACDAASASEIVVPIRVSGEIFGVIDIDSPLPANFDAEDLAGLQLAADQIGAFVQKMPRSNDRGAPFQNHVASLCPH